MFSQYYSESHYTVKHYYISYNYFCYFDFHFSYHYHHHYYYHYINITPSNIFSRIVLGSNCSLELQWVAHSSKFFLLKTKKALEPFFSNVVDFCPVTLSKLDFTMYIFWNTSEQQKRTFFINLISQIAKVYTRKRTVALSANLKEQTDSSESVFSPERLWTDV